MPDNELMHYGVKGMKWGVRRNPSKAYFKAYKKKIKLEQRAKTARLFADDHSSTAKESKKISDEWNKTLSVARRKRLSSIIDEIEAIAYDKSIKAKNDLRASRKGNRIARKVKKRSDRWNRLFNETFKDVPEQQLEKGKAKVDEYIRKNSKYFL